MSEDSQSQVGNTNATWNKSSSIAVIIQEVRRPPRRAKICLQGFKEDNPNFYLETQWNQRICKNALKETSKGIKMSITVHTQHACMHTTARQALWHYWHFSNSLPKHGPLKMCYLNDLFSILETLGTVRQLLILFWGTNVVLVSQCC